MIFITKWKLQIQILQYQLLATKKAHPLPPSLKDVLTIRLYIIALFMLSILA